MRILMIEDDVQLCASVKYQLEHRGFSVDVCHDGEEGLFLIRENAFDLILLDRMLPGMDGAQVLKTARREGIQTPILLVSALGELHSRVEGLDMGADDYIPKPFAIEELLARIRSALRRPSVWTDTQLLACGDVRYDSAQKTLSAGDKTCTLSRREGDLLELFLRNPGQTMPRSLILSRIWGPDGGVEEGNLDNYIHFLRRRLKSMSCALSIRTVRGVGYCLEVEHAE